MKKKILKLVCLAIVINHYIVLNVYDFITGLYYCFIQ